MALAGIVIKPSNIYTRVYCTLQSKTPITQSWLKFHLRLLSTYKHGRFSRALRGSFTQPKPQLHNPYKGDPFLRSILSRFMPREVSEEVSRDLESFGDRIVGEIDALGRQVELELPYHEPFDAWGNRVDTLITSSAWKRLHDVSAEEGLIALAYERQYEEWSRLHQVAKLYLFSPSSGLYSCPLAMTDGAAKLIESSDCAHLKGTVLSHLTTRDPGDFWTSGQWMTEKGGGSDVAGGTDTVAYGPESDGTYRLYGYKWFTSATDANMAFTLARLADEQSHVTEGTSGLSLFYLETRTEEGDYNNLEIQRLKNKLGTRQVPTAELLLDGTRALLVGKVGRGVPGISPMLTITRLHNSISAAGVMRRVVQLSRDYAGRRIAFKKLLTDHPLHMQTLAKMEVATRACTLLTMEVARLQGRVDTGLATDQERMCHRMLTPILKLYTAKLAVAVCSEGLESFGGQGYMEDTGLPTYLRDAQVLPIWEGTTNILSLDVLRVLNKYGQEALTALIDTTKLRLSEERRLESVNLLSSSHTLAEKIKNIVLFVQEAVQGEPEVFQNASRDFSLSLAQVVTGGLLVNHACSSEATEVDFAVAKRWAAQPLLLKKYKEYIRDEQVLDSRLVLEGYHDK